MLPRHSARTGRFGRPTSGMLILSRHASYAEGPRPHPTTSLLEGIEGLCVAIYPRHLTCSTRPETGCYLIARRRGYVICSLSFELGKGRETLLFGRMLSDFTPLPVRKVTRVSMVKDAHAQHDPVVRLSWSASVLRCHVDLPLGALCTQPTLKARGLLRRRGRLVCTSAT